MKQMSKDRERIRDFQRKLYLKAKQDKEFRFYVLYDKIRDKRFLKEAYKRVKTNKEIKRKNETFRYTYNKGQSGTNVM